MTDTNVKKIDNNLIKNNNEGNNKNANNESMDIIYDDKKDIYKINKIQFSIKIANKNFWGTIEQPKSFAIDRTCNNKNFLKKDKKTKHSQKSIKKIDDKTNKKKSFSLFNLKKNQIKILKI